MKKLEYMELKYHKLTTQHTDLVNKVDVKAGDLITLYYGAELKEENAAAHAELIKSFYGDVDIEVYNGGQPYYHYFVSFE